MNSLKPGSREHTVGWLSLRALWHEVYDPCPRVHAHLSDQADRRFEDFVETLVPLQHPMDWRLHLEFGGFCDIDLADLWDELCVAAVRRWVRTGSPDQAWIALRCAWLPGRVLVGLRAAALDQGPRIIRGRLTAPTGSSPPFMYQTGRAAFSRLAPDWTDYLPFLHGK